MKFEASALESTVGPFKASVNQYCWAIYCEGGTSPMASGNLRTLEANKNAATNWLAGFIKEVQAIKVDVRV